MERDIELIRSLSDEKISTHTLTWSVTLGMLSVLSVFAISTHTLTWSVTVTAKTVSFPTSFQLTRSRGA